MIRSAFEIEVDPDEVELTAQRIALAVPGYFSISVDAKNLPTVEAVLRRHKRRYTVNVVDDSVGFVGVLPRGRSDVV